MDFERLYVILEETTAELRNGEEREGAPEPVDVMGNKIVKVDLHFMVIGVNEFKAKQYKYELVAILKTYPQPERLAGGPSYIEVGGEIGGQGAALHLFALGKVLGLWDVITPEKHGTTGPKADRMAGLGGVMIDGFKAD